MDAENQPKQQYDRGRNRPYESQQPHLKISNTPPEKKGEAWESLVTATLGQGNKALSGREIKFFLGGVEVGADSTDEDGNASLQLELKPGKSLVKAQLVRSTAYRTVLINVEADKPKEHSLTKPRIRVSRNQKNHFFQIQVTDGHGKGHLCKVQVSSPEEPSVIVTLDEQGTGTHRIALKPKERSRFLEFSVIGTDLSTVSAAYAAKKGK